LPDRVQLHRAGRSRGVPLRVCELPRGSLLCLTFAPDSRILALGCKDRRVRLWDTRLGGQETLMQPDALDSLVFSPSGDLLAAGLRDGTIAVWDAKTRRPQRSWPAHSSAIRTLAISPDAHTLFSAGVCESVVKSWDLATGQVRNFWAVTMDWITSLAL